MLTWLLACRGITRLAATYLVLAAVAVVVAVGTFAVSAQHSTASGENTLQLHITRYHG
jgi:hypothetical protein